VSLILIWNVGKLEVTLAATGSLRKSTKYYNGVYGVIICLQARLETIYTRRIQERGARAGEVRLRDYLTRKSAQLSQRWRLRYRTGMVLLSEGEGNCITDIGGDI
jgi:hypothetical protein